MHTAAKKIGVGVLTTQEVRLRRNIGDMSFLYTSVASSFVIIAIVFAFLWSRLMVVNTGYEISKANSARSALTEKNKRLRVEFMKLKSPERIEKIASEELGLVRPTGAQVISLK